MRPDLCFAELRGNIATRLDKAPSGGAVVVACAALERLGISARAAEMLSTEVMLPQVGQGALALRCRADDTASIEISAAIDDPVVGRCVRAERSFLATLGGGCDAPVGAHATCTDISSSVHLEAVIASDDGHALVRGSLDGSDPDALGRALARRLLDELGGRSLFEFVANG